MLALIMAVGLHGLIYIILTYTPPKPLLPILDKAITVQIIENSPAPVTAPSTPNISETLTLETPISPPQEITPPAPKPKPIEPPPQIVPSEVAPNPPAPEPTTPQPITPVIIAAPPTDEEDEEQTPGTAYIPSEWALEPALSKNRLEGIFGEGFQNDIDCIRSLSEDCTALRKEVFAKYQLSKQDLIWSPSFAHNGLTDPDLHGLSEREIRQKLAIPIAGDNAFVILPGIAIDGNLWDTLHGVNKKCPVLRGIRRCPDLAPKADDKRFHIPKKDTP